REAEWAGRWWPPTIEAADLAVREAAAMIDLSAVAVVDVARPGAREYLQMMAMASVHKPVGRIICTPLLTPAGSFHSDLTIVRHGPQEFRIITGGADGARDLAWLRAHLPADGSVQLSDVTSGVCTIGVWGPRAREILTPLA